MHCAGATVSHSGSAFVRCQQLLPCWFCCCVRRLAGTSHRPVCAHLTSRACAMNSSSLAARHICSAGSSCVAPRIVALVHIFVKIIVYAAIGSRGLYRSRPLLWSLQCCRGAQPCTANSWQLESGRRRVDVIFVTSWKLHCHGAVQRSMSHQGASRNIACPTRGPPGTNSAHGTTGTWQTITPSLPTSHKPVTFNVRQTWRSSDP